MSGEKRAIDEGVRGAAEGIKGKVKQAFGAVTGNDELVREGLAQQDKGEAQRDAAKHQAQADAARAGATAAELREKSHQ